jgi:hypothetical protein
MACVVHYIQWISCHYIISLFKCQSFSRLLRIHEKIERAHWVPRKDKTVNELTSHLIKNKLKEELHNCKLILSTFFLFNGTNPIILTHTPCVLCSQDQQWYTTNWQWTVKLIESRGKAKTLRRLTSYLIKKKWKEEY